MTLKPCPFCGSSGDMVWITSVAFDSNTLHLARVVCQRCPAAGPEVSRATLVEAEEAAAMYWNRRAREGA